MEEPECRASCEKGLDERACRGQEAPDRLTCEQLTETVACNEYCVALCERAPSCGSFDARACVSGCLEVKPSICNSASVAARTCDQLKPEIKLYERVGSLSDGNYATGGSLGPTFGLCESSDDCEEPLGCSQETNTCAPCETNEDCADPYSPRVCNDANECEEVGCVVDADCILDRPCNTETHECGECREDAQCTSLYRSACNTDTLTCVECKKDADCKSGAFQSCDVEQQKCVACGDDSHCTSSFAPVCDTTTRTCVGCLKDADCADGELCDLDNGFCVADL